MLRRTIMFGLLLSPALGSSSAQEKQAPKPTRDAAAKEEIRVMRTAADILATAKDKKTADAAIVKLKALGEKVRKAKARYDQLGKPSEAERRAIEKKVQEGDS